MIKSVWIKSCDLQYLWTAWYSELPNKQADQNKQVGRENFFLFITPKSASMMENFIICYMKSWNYVHCRYKCLMYDWKKSKKDKQACSFIRNLRVCIEKENYKHLAVVAWPLTLRAVSASRSAITILCILSTKKWPVMKKSINMRSM